MLPPACPGIAVQATAGTCTSSLQQAPHILARIQCCCHARGRGHSRIDEQLLGDAAADDTCAAGAAHGVRGDKAKGQLHHSNLKRKASGVSASKMAGCGWLVWWSHRARRHQTTGGGGYRPLPLPVPAPVCRPVQGPDHFLMLPRMCQGPQARLLWQMGWLNHPRTNFNGQRLGPHQPALTRAP